MHCDTTKLARNFLAEPAGPVGHMAARAIEGDANSAQALMRWCGPQTGARVAFALKDANQWAIGREVGLGVWALWPDALVEEAQERHRQDWPEELDCLMRWWQMPVPQEISRRVIVWRAGAGGISWTASRDVACWYALRTYSDVYTTIINSDAPCLWNNVRGEWECVLTQWPAARQEHIGLPDLQDGARRFRAMQQVRKAQGLPHRLYDEEVIQR